MQGLLFAVELYLATWLVGLASLAVVEDYALARIAGPIVLTLVGFFIEHIHGMGRLPLAGPALALSLGWVAWRRRAQIVASLRRHWDVEAACAAGFLWALSWRWRFPDIDAVSEKMTSLVLVTAFGAGEKLPPIDPWLPPERLNVYYPLQHYGAGLAARLLHLEPPLAINLCFCLLVGLLAAAAWACVASRVSAPRRRAACMASLFLGGTGAALVVPLMSHTPQWPSATVRFIGEWGASPEHPTALGRRLAQNEKAAHLPVEIASYYVALGDYHPPLGGWVLLLLGLYAGGAAISATDERSRALNAGAALATVPLVAATNAWVGPLQALLVAGSLAPLGLAQFNAPDTASGENGRRLARRPARLLAPEVWGPPLIALALLTPFLAGFLGPASGRNPIRLVETSDRASTSVWLVTFWPLLVLLAAGALTPSREARRRVLLWGALLFFAEVFYVDDLYAQPFNRFNSYLKWMPWIIVGITVDLAPCALAHAGRITRAAVLTALLLPCVFAVSLAKQWTSWERPHPGRLEGHAWLTDDPAARAVLHELQSLPGGITLEYPPAMSYTSQSALSLLSGHATFIGWPNHEVTWRGQRDDIWGRYNEARGFYGGTMEAPAEWLKSKGIDHVVWLPEERPSAEQFDKLDRRLRPAFVWREAYREGDFRAGIWTRSALR